MYHLLVGNLLQPFFLIYAALALGLLNLWRKRRETRRRLLGITVPFVLLTLFCFPPVAHLAVGSLEWSYPPLFERPPDVEAIVVLSAGLRPSDETRSAARLDEDGLYRCLQAAEMYHQGRPCPVLVSGRQPDLGATGQTLAELMRDFLIQLGVPVADLIVEKNALTTYENAVECRKLLETRQIRKILLVTTASHLARAVGCFRQQGLEVIPCGCAYQTRFQLSLVESLPSLKAAVKSRRACHEWVGLAWYAMHGRR